LVGIPGVSHRRAVRALTRAGFRIIRQGRHTVLTDGSRIVTIPRTASINALTMAGIVKDEGLTPAEFRRWL